MTGDKMKNIEFENILNSYAEYTIEEVKRLIKPTKEGQDLFEFDFDVKLIDNKNDIFEVAFCIKAGNIENSIFLRNYLYLNFNTKDNYIKIACIMAHSVRKLFDAVSKITMN